jgi:hypothetical protein
LKLKKTHVIIIIILNLFRLFGFKGVLKLEQILSSYFVRNPNVQSRKLGSSFLLNFDGQIFELNIIAMEVWESLNDEKSLNDILVNISKEYDVHPDQLAADSLDLFKELINHKLVEKVAM